MKFGQNCAVCMVCTVKSYLWVQGGYLWVLGGYLWVQGGYLGSVGLSGWVGTSGRWVGQMGGQVRWVGTGYVRWPGS